MKLKNLPLLGLLIFSGNAAVDDYEAYADVGKRCISFLENAARDPFPKDLFESLINKTCIWKYNGDIIADGRDNILAHLKGNIQTAGGNWSVRFSERFIDSQKGVCTLIFTVVGAKILPHIVSAHLWVNKDTKEDIVLVNEVRGVVNLGSRSPLARGKTLVRGLGGTRPHTKVLRDPPPSVDSNT